MGFAFLNLVPGHQAVEIYEKIESIEYDLHLSSRRGGSQHQSEAFVMQFFQSLYGSFNKRSPFCYLKVCSPLLLDRLLNVEFSFIIVPFLVEAVFYRHSVDLVEPFQTERNRKLLENARK
jgi:hypothetical protein